MATKFECDRCGKQFDKDTDIATVSFPLYNRSQSYYKELDDITHKDLCKDCIADLNDFMKVLSKQV